MKKLFSLIMAFILSLGFIPSPSAKVLDIILEGNPILKKQSSYVERFDPALSELLDDMKETMSNAGGCGLAAPQIGKNINIFIVDIGKGTQEYINPIITKETGDQTGVEGCLSIPGRIGIVRRPKAIAGTAYNRKGEKFEFKASDFEAQVICHEYDHLKGILYTDKSLKTISNKKAAAISLTALVGGAAIIIGTAKAIYSFIS